MHSYVFTGLSQMIPQVCFVIQQAEMVWSPDDDCWWCLTLAGCSLRVVCLLFYLRWDYQEETTHAHTRTDLTDISSQCLITSEDLIMFAQPDVTVMSDATQTHIAL